MVVGTWALVSATGLPLGLAIAQVGVIGVASFALGVLEIYLSLAYGVGFFTSAMFGAATMLVLCHVIQATVSVIFNLPLKFEYSLPQALFGAILGLLGHFFVWRNGLTRAQQRQGEAPIWDDQFPGP